MEYEKRPFTTQEINRWVDSMIRTTRTEDPMKIAGRKDCIRDIRRAKKKATRPDYRRRKRRLQ